LAYRQCEDNIPYLKRLEKIDGVEVDNEPSEENLLIEIVSRARSGEFDLFVYAIDSRAVKKDVLNRIFTEAPISVMIVTG